MIQSGKGYQKGASSQIDAGCGKKDTQQDFEMASTL